MQYIRDNLFNELIVDNFVGVGSASIGSELHKGKKYSEAKQIARLENAICPSVATALIRANCADIAYRKPLRTVSELDVAICGAGE